MDAARIWPVALLLVSNVFMTFAWYGHLKYKHVALWMVILTSWLIALPEYMLAVPANRMGSSVYSAAQLKGMQEIITLSVFAVFSILYLGQKITMNHLIGFALIAAGGFFLFRQ
ncbi:DMT family protein [Sphingomonas sp.]